MRAEETVVPAALPLGTEPAAIGGMSTNNALRNGDEADARMEEIQKILGHAAMHLLDRYGLVAEWVRHAEAKAGVFDQIVAKPKGGRPEGGIKRAASGELPIPGKTFLGRRKYIERAIRIDSIFEEAKSAVRAAGLDNIQCSLLAIAYEHSLDAQIAKIKEIAARRSVPRRKSTKSPTQRGMAAGTNPRNAAYIPERDETMTAEQEAQLASLRTSWRIDGVLRRAEFGNVSTVIQGCFIRDELFGTSVAKVENEGSTAEAATVAPSECETPEHGATTSQDAAETDSAER